MQELLHNYTNLVFPLPVGPIIAFNPGDMMPLYEIVVDYIMYMYFILLLLYGCTRKQYTSVHDTTYVQLSNKVTCNFIVGVKKGNQVQIIYIMFHSLTLIVLIQHDKIII